MLNKKYFYQIPVPKKKRNILLEKKMLLDLDFQVNYTITANCRILNCTAEKVRADKLSEYIGFGKTEWQAAKLLIMTFAFRSTWYLF